MARIKKNTPIVPSEMPSHPLILGYAHLRVTGKSGDAVAPYPRIASLDMIELLPEDGQAAIHAAMDVVREAQRKQNGVFAITQLATETSMPVMHPLRPGEFDVTALETIIVPRIVGG